MINTHNMIEDTPYIRVKTSTFKTNSKPYKEKSKSREKKKDYSEQRRKKREFE